MDDNTVSEEIMTEKKKNRKLRIGVCSSVGIVVILALAVLANILIDKLNLSWDLSQEGIYSISDQSKSIVSGLEQDVTIYILNSEEGFPTGYRQILQQYEKVSKHIIVAYRDLTVYPKFAYEYVDSSTTIHQSSLIVVCGDKSVYLDSDEFSSTGLSEDGSSYSTSLEFEPLLTSAINSVNDGETSIIYQTNGHNELTFSNSIQTGILRDNYTLKDVTLLNQNAVPEDADILLINAPTSDFSKEDCDKIREFLDAGGNVYFIMEATVELKNLEALMKDYGIEAVEGIVMEQNPNMIYGETPTYIIPKIENTEITGTLYNAKMALIVPIAKGLSETTGTGYTVTGLLSTSDYAYSKVNLDSEYVSREDDDIVGPFYLAALSEKEDGGRLLVLSSSNMCTDQVNEIVSGNNIDFLLNGLNYLIGDENKISIRGKEIQYDTNVYTTNQIHIFSGVAEFGIPVLILIVGILVVVCRKRRSQLMKHRKKNEENELPMEEQET